MTYRAADNPDRVKALGGVVVVHAALAALIFSGLTVHTVSQAVEQLKTFDIREVPPPPPPPPSPRAERAKDKEGAAGRKALPTPVVAQPPRIVVPYQPPVVAARIASTGSATTAGAATAGSGTGAGGSGNGLGGGGNDFSGFTPAQRISRIPNREYRHLVAVSGRRTGTVGITLKVNTDGAPSNCRIARSSGDRTVDSLMCDLALQYVRFRPARNNRGQPVAQDISWYPDWSPNF